MARSLVSAVAAGCAALGLSGAAAAAGGGQPAFYTDQAPGGAATAGQRVIALTFDDGPGPYTPQVLSVLEQYHVPATFFEIGEEVAAYPQDTRMVASAGYPVEDHTWSHPDLDDVPATQFGYQIDQTQNLIRSLVGATPACVRPPYDDVDAAVLGWLSQRGLTAMSYSVDPRDWSRPGVQAIVDSVVGAASPGAVVDLHDGGGDRSETVAALPRIITGLRSEGYGFVSICGYLTAQGPQQSAVYPYGPAPPAGPPLVSDSLFSGMAAEGPVGGGGYWLCARDGGVFAEGAPYEGSLPGLGVTPFAPVVGMAGTPDGGGYWLVSSDGGVFAFGDARYLGSLGAARLGAPVVGMAATPEGGGYWLASSDGGVFAFGDARFEGSVPGLGVTLAAPVVGMAADPDGGYWLASSDGGVFAFGDAPFKGSLPAAGITPSAPVVGVAASTAPGGYRLAAADGGAFSFSAPFDGSQAGEATGGGFFAIAATSGGGYLLAAGRPPGS